MATCRSGKVIFPDDYPDGIGRTVKTANYGTNGDADSIPTHGVCPAGSDTILVSAVVFNDRGEAFQTINPLNSTTPTTTNQTTRDDAGRKTQFIQNYVSGGTGADQNIITNWTYDTGGHMAGIHAINADTGEQITSFSYGVTVAGGSTINSLDVLRVETMPDGGATVKEVNRQGEVILLTDANGTVHQYSRNKLGQPTDDAVVTLASGVDDAVLRIGLSYDVCNRPEKVTSYDAASGGSVVNEVQNAYNGFWQLQTQYQEHSGAVVTTTSLNVGYSYADGLGNTIRPTGLMYPNGKQLYLVYSTLADSKLSRISALSEDSLLNGLKTYWPLNEDVTSGTRYDAHGSNDLADVYGNVGSVNNHTSANLGLAAEFSTTPAQLLAAAPDGLGFSSSFTTTGWFRLPGTGANYGLWGKGDAASGTGTNQEWVVYSAGPLPGANNLLNLGLSDGTSGNSLDIGKK